MKSQQGTIPFVDLKAQYRALKGDIDSAMHRVIGNADFIMGADVAAFEKEFANYIKSPHCLSLDSGTTALVLALKALDIRPGDEVITPANGYISSALAISQCGATPILIDCNEEDYLMDIGQMERAVTKKTKAIIPVHLYGQCADMKPIIEIGQKRGIRIIEDACQAHGSTYGKKMAGSMGDIGCFSFYPGKNLGCYGDGGAIVCNDEKIAQKIFLLRNYGQKVKYHHLIKGLNHRLDTIQAAILRAKLCHLPKAISIRRAHAKAYTDFLLSSKAQTPVEKPYGKHAYHIYCVRVANRDAIQKKLAKAGIQTNIHYPTPIHLQPAYADLGKRKGSYPVCESQSDQILSLPMYPELTEQQIEFVCSELKKAIR